MKLLTGDIILFKPTSLIGKIICYVSKSPYSHASIIVNNWHIPAVNESQPRGIISPPAQLRLQGETILIKRYKNTMFFSEEKFAIHANSHLGKRYDFISTLFFQLIFQLTGIWIGKHSNAAERRLYCSEYVALVYNKTVGIFPEWWKVDPKHLWQDRKLQFITVYEGDFNALEFTNIQ